ncbi:cellulose binding domain-containing protein [Micromonospora sp. NBC_00362]|uniref:cellulose binding domain-containing protein n=1 Tax=Micromonospora sp. NBC_00362 TaxID=2975975 RepID=UPI0022559EF6|nr:cellulose binding domain-containing protein [Micromonospora sp. NBC_00362]MCX5121592.1 cellulose binding domain-containing protein [Micromonospora sp. NBC_00362]
MSGMRRVPRPPHGPVAIATSPWIVVGAGVVVMVVLLIVALGAYRGRSPAPDGARPPALPVPSAVAAPSVPTSVPSPAPVLPGISGRASGLPPSVAAGSGSPSADPTAGPIGKPTATRSPSRAASGQPAMTGRYRVVQSFDGGFIGEVAMVNTSTRSRGWTVRLQFLGGRLVTAWVEGVPQGTIRQSDDGFTYVSGVDVSPGGSVSLRFHLERASSTPRECTVDGARCSGL